MLTVLSWVSKVDLIINQVKTMMDSAWNYVEIDNYHSIKTTEFRKELSEQASVAGYLEPGKQQEAHYRDMP